MSRTHSAPTRIFFRVGSVAAREKRFLSGGMVKHYRVIPGVQTGLPEERKLLRWHMKPCGVGQPPRGLLLPRWH